MLAGAAAQQGGLGDRPPGARPLGVLSVPALGPPEASGGTEGRRVTLPLGSPFVDSLEKALAGFRVQGRCPAPRVPFTPARDPGARGPGPFRNRSQEP
jgi:hypothetical protein